MDGTHGLAPEELFKQLYTVHCRINGKNLPMIYFLLTNKCEQTYTRMLRMIDNQIKIKPNSINIDFEKAIFNSISDVWPKCNIYGYFFHLAQAMLRNVNKRHKIVYRDSAEFRKAFRMMQALAYVPTSDVIDGFLLLKTIMPPSFEPIYKFINLLCLN